MNKPFTISEIKKQVKHLKNNKATSCDLVMNEMLKHGATIILPAMCKVFNLILDNGVFPTQWNTTYQVPVFKSGDCTNCNNYRGIAVSSCLGKVYTSLLQSRLLVYVEESGNISENQAASRKGKSTSDHIFVIKSLVNRYLRVLKKNLILLFHRLHKSL